MNDATGDFNADANPYAPTMVEATPLNPHEDAVAIRKRYLSHEASVKSIGTLYFLGAIFLVPFGLFIIGSALYGLASQGAGAAEFAIVMLVGVLEAGLGVAQGLTAFGLWKLKSWSRIVGIVFAVIGLIGFPIGTLISAYFLYLLASQKGQYVFSDEYQQVIALTPEIKYKTSIIVWIFLGLLVALIGFGLIAALVGGLSR